MNLDQKKKIENEISELEKSLTGDMMTDMQARDRIHNLKMKLNGVKPEGQEIDCEGCGS